jgi:CarboxypepD_reg-like domain
MANKLVFMLFFFIGFTMAAQTKGVVVDENGKPIPYVNIWVEDENIAASSEENGVFIINVKDKNKNLIFSALGFEKKTVKVSDAAVVKLNTSTVQLTEVLILNKKETKEVEIGNTDNSIFQAFENGPRIDAKFFPYNPAYKKTKFIKAVSVYTDSKIDNATIKIHLYEVDSEGLPGRELLEKDFIVSVKKGQRRTIFNVSALNLTMSKKGIFVAIERLLIERNKLEKTINDLNTNTKKTQITYFPLILCGYVERSFLCTFYGGKWNKEKGEVSQTRMIFEPAINLILTN